MPESDSPSCCLCSRELLPAEAESTACRRCQDVIDGHLAELPDLHAQLGQHLELTHTAGPYVTGGGVEPPAPLNVAALSLVSTGGIATVLAAWEDSWRAAMGADPADHSGAATSAAWLRGALRWASSPAYRPEHLAEFAGEIRQLHRDADRIVHPAEPPTTIGRCPRTRDNTSNRPCGGRLQIPAGGTTLRCTRCNTPWDKKQWATLRRTIEAGPDAAAA
ncbi:hypothetical protein [Kitasatospora sp. MBT63]|uniref:hypothetical protein n=1 Tax=Kitasatospora sp. MBT63 TaxID=1444768 RepID=UPI0005396EAC|nr:hypothetical protein [Kitasatospora sp. MBT63]